MTMTKRQPTEGSLVRRTDSFSFATKGDSARSGLKWALKKKIALLDRCISGDGRCEISGLYVTPGVVSTVSLDDPWRYCAHRNRAIGAAEARQTAN